MMTIIVLWILLSIIALIVIVLHFSVRVHLKYDENGFDFSVKYLFFDVYPRKPKGKKLKRKRKAKKDNAEESDDIDSEFDDNIDDDFSEVGQSDDYDRRTDDKENDTSVQNEQFEEQTDDIAEDTVEVEFAEKQPTDDAKQKKAENKKERRLKKRKNKDEPDKQEPASGQAEKKESKLAQLKNRYYMIKPYIPKGWKYFKKLLSAIRITGVEVYLEVGREDAHEAVIYYGTVQGVLFNLLGNLANIFTVKIKRADVNCIFTKNTFDGRAECWVKVRPSTIIAIAFCIGINFLIIFIKQKLKKRAEQKSAEKTQVDNNMEVEYHE